MPRMQNFQAFKSAMELTRRYFLVACYTGLRHSNLWQFKFPRITYIKNTPCLEVLQQKTEKKASIPLFDDLYHMIRNPGGLLLPGRTNERVSTPARDGIVPHGPLNVRYPDDCRGDTDKNGAGNYGAS